ncbi:MAG: tRNA ((7)-)-methyltransferase [Pseudomonadota bacterium]|jgi:tRNA (guanine-N7-)-methyltransferase
MLEKQPHFRKINSFVRREGRLTQAQVQALSESTHLLDLNTLGNKPIDWTGLFGWESNKHVLEMGFGDGASLLEMAQVAPETQFIGIEVYRSGVGNLLNKINKTGLNNLKVIMADAEEVIEPYIAVNSLDVIQVFFPDPWHKKRHHKRRLLDREFVEVLVQKLKIGGILHAATDWADYATQMLAVFSAHPALKNVATPPNQLIDRPIYRPITKYEKRGLRLGHAIADIQFCKLKHMML